jgi:hypothetical protein
MKRILIFGTSYINTADKQWLAEQWARVLKDKNPDCDLLIVDSASPMHIPSGVELFQFPDNIGHLMSTGRDGFGRAFCKGLDLAVERGYDAVAAIDADYLFMQPVRPIAEAIAGFASPPGPPYPWCELGISFASCAWLKDSKLTTRYDWQHMSRDVFPEHRFRELAEPDFKWLYNLRGYRNDDGRVDLAQLDWLTHGPITTYKAFLTLHGYSV